MNDIYTDGKGAAYPELSEAFSAKGGRYKEPDEGLDISYQIEPSGV